MPLRYSGKCRSPPHRPSWDPELPRLRTLIQLLFDRILKRVYSLVVLAMDHVARLKQVGRPVIADRIGPAIVGDDRCRRMRLPFLRCPHFRRTDRVDEPAFRLRNAGDHVSDLVWRQVGRCRRNGMCLNCINGLHSCAGSHREHNQKHHYVTDSFLPLLPLIAMLLMRVEILNTVLVNALSSRL